MGIYVITGGTTGIGASVREKLLEQGHEVFNIDYKGGDYLADLSTKEGREGAVNEVTRRYHTTKYCRIVQSLIFSGINKKPALKTPSLQKFPECRLLDSNKPGG